MICQTGYNSLLYYSGTVFSLLGFKNGAAAGLIVSGGNALFVVSAEGEMLFTRIVELIIYHLVCGDVHR